MDGVTPLRPPLRPPLGFISSSIAAFVDDCLGKDPPEKALLTLRLICDECNGRRRALLTELKGNTPEDLTLTEKSVARLLADGLSQKEIAAALGRSVKTVDTHLRNLYRKSGSHNRVQFVLWFLGKTP